MSWFPGGRLLVIVCLVAAVLLTACPPPITPHPPRVYPISRCTEVFPANQGSYTRPTPTNHPIGLLSAPEDFGGQWIMWLDRNCNTFFRGPLDYRYPNTPFCAFHPELGDRVYSGSDGFIIPIPEPCDGSNAR